MKVLTVVGNRPQFIKAAPLSMALREAGIEEISLHTGQHYDDTLSAIFYEELALTPPAYALDLRSSDPELMRPGIAAAVAAAHVEAGLRSGALTMPEERNRIEVDRVSALLLCPDERSRAILAAEGVTGRAEVVGDVMADAARVFFPPPPDR